MFKPNIKYVKSLYFPQRYVLYIRDNYGFNNATMPMIYCKKDLLNTIYVTLKFCGSMQDKDWVIFYISQLQ